MHHTTWIECSIFTLWAAITISIVHILKTRYHFRSEYTRKIYHILIFSSAWFIQTYFGYHALLYFASIIVLILLLVIYLGKRIYFYRALAYKNNGEETRRHIIIALLATAVGGLASNSISVALAPVGYLVVGWGDAAGGIIGTKFGNHTYHIPLGKKILFKRSIEGSLAVFVFSWIACLTGLLCIHVPMIPACCTALLASTCATAVEAMSIYNLDNCAMQIVVTLALQWLLSHPLSTIML